MLEEFNEGRSKSFYCIATALLPIDDLESIFQEIKLQINNEKIELNNLKAKSKILREHLTKLAQSKLIELKLRRK